MIPPPELPDGIRGDGPYNDPNEDGNLGIALGVGIPVALALMIAGFFVSRRQIVAARHLRLSDAGLYGASTMGTAAALDTRQMVGTGDPPGSFHEGLYHYMGDGTRYLSTNCAHCLETRRNSFYTDHNLGTIPEDQEYEDAIYGLSSQYQDGNGDDYDDEDEEMSPFGGSTYLGHLVRGRAIARPNVHVCNSALCDYCNGRKKQSTTFLESPALWLARTGNAAMEPMDSLLTFGSDDVTSSRAGEQEV